MNLERTSLYNESWKANAPTVRDLLAIEREKRNAYISAELAERDYNNDYDHSYDNAHDLSLDEWYALNNL